MNRTIRHRETEPTEAEVLAAYHQGKRDHAAGRSINAPKYADKLRDEAWHRGMCDAMRQSQKALKARCR